MVERAHGRDSVGSYKGNSTIGTIVTRVAPAARRSSSATISTRRGRDAATPDDQEGIVLLAELDARL